MFIPVNLLIGLLPSGVSYFRILFLLILGILGYFVAKNIEDKRIFLPIYFLFFFSFGSALADQYFVIPLITTLIFYKRIESILFHLIAGTYLATFSLNNISSISNIYNFKLGNNLIPLFPYNLKGIITPNPETKLFDMNTYNNYYLPQFYLLLMSIIFMYKLMKKEKLEVSSFNKPNLYILLYGLFYFYIIFIIILRKLVIDNTI